ncbi:hypothetical protein ACP70R_042225 [Stipagrostis hirtigluma subsp. patula]
MSDSEPQFRGTRLWHPVSNGGPCDPAGGGGSAAGGAGAARTHLSSPRVCNCPGDERLVAGGFESAAALARLERYGSSSKELLDDTPSEELITETTQTVPRNTIENSTSTVPFRREKALVADAVEGSSLEELIDTTSLEESIIASPRTVPQSTTDGSKKSASSLGSNILICKPPNWYKVYFIRRNRWGSFSMYPDLGGPFQSIGEAEGAIDRHLDKLRCPAMLKKREQMSVADRVIHDRKYYPDGTPKRVPRSERSKNVDLQESLVRAVVDHYNDAHNLFGDHAHELDRLVRHSFIDEDEGTYYHFNFTVKTKEADDNCATSGNLFFAEVSRMKRIFEVTCCCNIDQNIEGLCYGCRSTGCPDMKHPNDTDAYTGGRLDGPYDTYGGCPSISEDEEDEDARLNYMYKCLDDPNVLERIFRRATQLRESGEVQG